MTGGKWAFEHCFFLGCFFLYHCSRAVVALRLCRGHVGRLGDPVNIPMCHNLQF